MSIKRKLKNDLAEIQIPIKKRILPSGENTIQTIGRRPAFIPVLATLLCIAVIGTTAFAAPSLVKYFNANILSKDNRQLDTVPEGYTGIYTVSDLEAVRENPEGNFIMMNDIVFSEADYDVGGICEGGWIPIGSETDDALVQKYSGIFNGNGYVIQNLKINTGQAVKKPYYGLFGDTAGHFINLGIENCTENIAFDNSVTYNGEYVCVGTVAATATFIGGCYTKNTQISISLENLELEYDSPYASDTAETQKNLCVGGLAGISDYIDSCKSEAEISVYGKDSFTLYGGICAGRTLSCLSSLAVGLFDDTGFSYKYVDLVAYCYAGANMPVLFDEETMDKLIARVAEHYGDSPEGEFNTAKIQSFFIYKDPAADSEFYNVIDKYLRANSSFGYLSEEYDSSSRRYMFDMAASAEEKEMINDILSEVFGSYDALCEFYTENNIKCGMMYCYYFESEEDIEKKELVGFDFDNVWREKDGCVIPSIFVN